MTVLSHRVGPLDKGCCKFFYTGNCHKFHCRCFDCKEYLTQPAYRRKVVADENWRSIM